MTERATKKSNTPNRAPKVVQIKDQLERQEEIISKIDTLQAQLDNMQQHMIPQNKASADDFGVQFLLTEYNSLAEYWKHTDARFESGANLYLTTNALIVSAIVFFSQNIKALNLFFAISAFVALGLAVLGLMLARRMLWTAFNKSQYIYARDIIRRYFDEKYPNTAPYLYLSLSDIHRGNSQFTDKPIRPRIPRTVLSAIHLWIALLIGLSVSIMIWLVASYIVVSYIDLLAIVTSGIFSTLLIFIILTLRLRAIVNKFDLRRFDK